MIEGGPMRCPSPDGRSSLETSTSALRRGLEDHFELAIAELTRRQLMAAVDNTAKTGKSRSIKGPAQARSYLPRVVTSGALRDSWPEEGRPMPTGSDAGEGFLLLPTQVWSLQLSRGRP